MPIRSIFSAMHTPPLAALVLTSASAFCLGGTTAFAQLATTGNPPLVLPPGAAAQSTVGTPGLRGSDVSAALGFPASDSTLPTSLPPAADGSTTDYGRVRPKKAQLYKPNPRVSPPLPPLTTYQRAMPTKRPGVGTTPLDLPPPGPTVAVVPPLLQPPKRAVEDKPFAPVGIGVGALRLRPFVETGLGYDSNPNLQSTSKGSPFLRLDAGVGVVSDWSSNSLTADLRGGYSDFLKMHSADRPDASAKIVGRVDVTRNTEINLEERLNLSTQTPGSPQLAVPGSTFIVDRPSILTYGSTLGGTQRFNRLSVSLRGTFDRYEYADGRLSDGSTLLLSTYDYNDYGLIGRVGYEVTPGLIPYVEVTGDERLHDKKLDLGGFARNSQGIGGKAGTTYELTRILTGEVGVGYADRTYVDPRLPHLKAPTVDGSLVWALTPLTTATLRTTTFLSETTGANTSGAVSRNVSLEIGHALFRNFTLTGIGTFQSDVYQGQPLSDKLYSGSLKAEYNLSREVSVKGSYTHSVLASNFAGGANYTSNVFLVGLRLQR